MNSFDSVVRYTAQENGWEKYPKGRKRLEKDGYEIYFHKDDGYELTIRDPETMERKAVYEWRGIDTHSPLYVAFLLYIIENVENVVSLCTDEQ